MTTLEQFIKREEHVAAQYTSDNSDLAEYHRELAYYLTQYSVKMTPKNIHVVKKDDLSLGVNTDSVDVFCPSCMHKLEATMYDNCLRGDRYCPQCGQALNWYIELCEDPVESVLYDAYKKIKVVQQSKTETFKETKQRILNILAEIYKNYCSDKIEKAKENDHE